MISYTTIYSKLITKQLIAIHRQLAQKTKRMIEMNKKNIVTSPVKYSSQYTQLIEKTKSETDFNNDMFDGDDSYYQCDAPTMQLGGSDGKVMAEDEHIDKMRNRKNKSNDDFADQIKIDFIQSIDFRILCRFLGVTSVNEVQNHPYQSHPLITLILMESINGFMEKEGYDFVGELNFDNHGNAVPPEKNPWTVRGKETTFTTTGFLYFEKIDGKKKDNIAFFLFSDLERGGASITSYSTDKNKSKDIINNLQIYAKAHNCLRGAKLKDVNMIAASFSEVDVNKGYTWENYYYNDKIKDLFKLEVFDFIENVEKYNKCGINKRGIIIFGKPGTGKTTIGNIVCNMVPNNTVIWITPEILSENNYKAMSSIKALYKLADFLSPCIIMLEDLDLFSQDRDRGGDVLSLGALMNILDGVNTISNSVTIGTTNRLKSIEGALRNRPGRFDRIIEISHLSEELRRKMFKERLKSWKVSDETFEFIIEKTEDWTGAEVQEFVNGLNLKQISSKKKTKKIDNNLAEEVIATMNSFGVGEASSSFGFGK